MKHVSILLSGVWILAVFALATAGNTPGDTTKDSPRVDTVQSARPVTPDQVVVSYLHSNRRCATCRKLEAYSQEAVMSGFASELEDSSLVWRTVNFEDEGNEHYVKDYELFSQSLVLSRLHAGKEVEWKKLDKIWELVGDRDAFIAYVQAELKAFLAPAEKTDG